MSDLYQTKSYGELPIGFGERLAVLVVVQQAHAARAPAVITLTIRAHPEHGKHVRDH